MNNNTKMARIHSKKSVSQKEANDSLRALVPEAVQFLQALIADDGALIKDRLTAAKLVIDKAVPTSGQYEDETIKPIEETKVNEKKNNIYALADVLKAASNKTRKQP